MAADASPIQVSRTGGAFAFLVGGLFATLMVAVPRSWLAVERFSYPKGMLFHTAALVTGVTCLAWGRRWRLDAVDLCLGVFAALGVLSAVSVAHNSWLALGSLGVTTSGSVIWLGSRSLAEGGRRKELLLAVALVAGVFALSVLLEAYGPLQGLSLAKRAPGGTLGHRNHAAHLLVLSLPVCWFCLTWVRNRRMLGVLLVCVVMAGAAITLSRSRTAWLATFVLGLGMVGTAWALGRRGAGEARWRTAGFVAALGVGAGLALAMPNTLEWRGSYMDTLRRMGEHDAGSGRGRLIQYANTLRMIADAPLLGVGPGNWTVQYPRYTAPGDPSYAEDEIPPVAPLPQSDWLGMLAERGIPALLVLAAAAGRVLAGCWRGARTEASLESRAEAIALTAVLAGLGVLGCLDTVLLTPTATLFVAVIVGALARSQRERVVMVPGPLGRRAMIATVVLLTGGPLAYGAVKGWARRQLYIKPLTRERLARAVRLDPGGYEARVLMGEQEAREGQCEQALAILREAERLMPHTGASLRAGAWCQQSRRDSARAASTAPAVAPGL